MAGERERGSLEPLLMNPASPLSIVAGKWAAVSAVAGNRYYADKIASMRDGTERGEPLLRTATLTGIFTPVVLQMLAVGEETAELDDLMQEVAVMYEQEVEYEISTLSQQIEPILIVALGAMVLVLALGVFLPMWDLATVKLGAGH